jgi:hypothetical protein
MPRNNPRVRVHRPAGGGDPRVPVPAAAGRLVQQHRVERRAAHPQAVQPRPRALRVEQASGQEPKSELYFFKVVFRILRILNFLGCLDPGLDL